MELNDVRGDENGVWIETECIAMSKCKELKKQFKIYIYKIES